MLEAAQAAAVPRGKVRMTCGLSFGLRHLSHAVSAFLRRYPEVQVELDLSDRFVDLGDEGYDLAIRIGTLAESTLVARRLATTHVVACASPEYLAQRGTPETPGALRGHSCLIYAYRPQPRVWTFRRGSAEETVPVDGPVRVNNGDFLLELALDGHGLVLAPSFIAGEALASGRLVRVLDDWDAGELGIHAVYTQRKFVPARVRALLDFLVERFGDPAYWQAAAVPAPAKQGARKPAAARKR
jgi:DNA-binding transcriptional LysR family regulator